MQGTYAETLIRAKVWHPGVLQKTGVHKALGQYGTYHP